MVKKLILQIRGKKDISAPSKSMSLDNKLSSGDGIARDLKIGTEKVTTEDQIAKTISVDGTVVSTMLLMLTKSTVGVAVVAGIGKAIGGALGFLAPFLRGLNRFLFRHSLTFRASTLAYRLGRFLRGLFIGALKGVWRLLGKFGNWFMKTRLGKLLTSIVTFPARLYVGLREIGRLGVNAFYRTAIGQRFLYAKALVNAVKRGITAKFREFGRGLYNLAIHKIYGTAKFAIAAMYGFAKHAIFRLAVAAKTAFIRSAFWLGSQALIRLGFISRAATGLYVMYKVGKVAFGRAGVALGRGGAAFLRIGRTIRTSVSRSLIGRTLGTLGRVGRPAIIEFATFFATKYFITKELKSMGFSDNDSMRVGTESAARGLVAAFSAGAIAGMGVGLMGMHPVFGIGGFIVGGIMGIAGFIASERTKNKFIHEQLASGGMLPSTFNLESLELSIGQISEQVSRDIAKGHASGTFVRDFADMDLNDEMGTIGVYRYSNLYHQPLINTIGVGYDVEIENNGNLVTGDSDINGESTNSEDSEEGDDQELEVEGYQNPSTPIIKYFENRGPDPYGEHKVRVEGRIKYYEALEREYRAAAERLIRQRERIEAQTRERRTVSSGGGSREGTGEVASWLNNSTPVARMNWSTGKIILPKSPLVNYSPAPNYTPARNYTPVR